jgi:hypothetical protein
VRRNFGVGGAFLERGNKCLRPKFHVSSDENKSAGVAQMYLRSTRPSRDNSPNDRLPSAPLA